MKQKSKFELSSIFSDNIVLQREKPIPVWGRSMPSSRISVAFAGQERLVQADAKGRWNVLLDPIPASMQPRSMFLQSQSDFTRSPESEDILTLRLDNILIGDVYYCSGQSNMELGMGAIAGKERELIDTDYPGIRFLLILKTANGIPQETIDARWKLANRESLCESGWSGFSAVAYTFARKIHKESGIPIGIIQAAYGGCPIEAWLPRDELFTNPDLAKWAEKVLADDTSWEKAKCVDPKASYPFVDTQDCAKLPPASCFNAMLQPILPFALRGILWYQGETNAPDQSLYTLKQNALINSWRRHFGQGPLPFYFAQIAPWGGYAKSDPLPPFWEAQAASLALPNTGMVATIDLGDAADIHPTRKREVGERFALLALAGIYGRADIDPSGPRLGEARVSGRDALLEFDHAGSGLVSVRGELKGFELAGADGVFHAARAMIAETGTIGAVGGSCVILSSPKVAHPAAVRYAWSDVPDANLANSEGLPAWPFFRIIE